MHRLSPLRSCWLLIGLATAACSTPNTDAPPPIVRTVGSVEMSAEDPVPTAWKTVVTTPDLDRLGRAKAAWEAALSEAREAGFGKDIEAEAELLNGTTALPRAAPPPGPYSCRVVKLGSQGKSRPFTAYKAFNCYVEAEGDLLTIVKQTGSQRPAGRLWPDGDERMIFLGAMALDEESEPPAYAADAERDVVGYVERVAPFRWRMVMPWPRQESKLDVLELIPVTPEPKPVA